MQNQNSNNNKKVYLNNNNNHVRNAKSPSPDRFLARGKGRQPGDKKYSVVEEMEKMRQRREERKKRIEDEKRNKIEMLNNPDYIPRLDVDYENMISQKRKIIESQIAKNHTTSDQHKIFVCVRKRPIFPKEIQNGEIDCITALNPKVCVYDCKMKIDGITKYIDANEFYFDNVFNEYEDTDLLYNCSVKPAIKLLLQGGVVTCFAYGQTGSGKTFTMKGIQDSAIDSLFSEFGKIGDKYEFYVSFFEIYSGRLYDLLNNRNKVMALEDKNQKVQIFGLEQKKVETPKEMKDVVEYANTMRTTHNTVTNETSSRSHAICNFVIKEKNKPDDEYAKLTLVDLAGSERATETQSNNKSRLAEGAEINKSLLALKECIRGLDARKTTGNAEQHVPFRTSKLTLVLRDSFISKSNISKIIMISCISPGYSSANHTINTLRYSDRLKEKTSQMQKKNNNNNDYHRGSFINKVPNVFTQKDNSVDNIYQNKDKKDNLLNNFINEDVEVEDDLQKLNLGPTPISKPSIQSHKPKYMIAKEKKKMQKKTPRSNNNNLISQPQNNIHQIDYLKQSMDDSAPKEQIYSDEVNYINEDKQEVIPDLLEEQDFLISSHMNILKEEAKLLTEEGTLISNIKGVTQDNYPMDEYAMKLDDIIKKKLQHYAEIKKKIENYKKILSTSSTASNFNH